MRLATESGAGIDLLSRLYVDNYASLVRLAALLVDDLASAEDVVQEAYARLASSRKLPDDDRALAYLRQTVVNLSRSTLRRRLLGVTKRPAPNADTVDMLERLSDRDEIVTAIRTLPRRHREVIALRYLLDQSEADTARMLGISAGAVKGYASRALAQLAKALGAEK